MARDDIDLRNAGRQGQPAYGTPGYPPQEAPQGEPYPREGYAGGYQTPGHEQHAGTGATAMGTAATMTMARDRGDEAAARDMWARNDDREPDTKRRPETKSFVLTSEFWAAVGAVVALMLGAYWLEDISREDAWLWSTFVAIAYIVSRGLAKAGAQRSYDRANRR